MRAGRLDRFITLQRKTVTQSDTGAEIETWTDIDLRRPASYAPVRGEERIAVGPQIVATEQVEFQIRYTSDVADLSSLDRIIYPALTNDSPEISPRNVYDILAVLEINRREGLRIIAFRNPDVGS